METIETSEVGEEPIGLRYELIICLAAPFLLLLNVGVCAGAWMWWNSSACAGGPRQAASIESRQLEQMVDEYIVVHELGAPPPRLEVLTQGPRPVVTTLPRDPWGNAYAYERNGLMFEVFSVGPDGDAGTRDDVRQEKW